MVKNPLVIICGPTATGKTSLAMELAKEFGGEIVSADSRQVYRYMDIGTGKEILNIKYKQSLISRKLEMEIVNIHIKKQKFVVYKINDIPIWLWDLVSPNQKFSVSHWVRFAEKIIKDIWQRRKLPIIVGGTGFYLKGLLQGFETLGIPPDWKFREQLETKTLEQLQQLLQKLNPERWQRMNKSDRGNPRRLIRAIEIIKSQKSPKNKLTGQAPVKSQNYISKVKSENTLIIGLKADYQTLYQRIDKRVEERVKQGIIKEIKGLLEKGYSWDNPGFNTLGYKEFKDYFKKKATLEEVIQKWKYDEHAYARRQMTWFKKALRQAQGEWFDITKKGWQNKVIKQVSQWAYDRKN